MRKNGKSIFNYITISTFTYASAVHDSAAVIGMNREAGADEDDFHAFKRTTKELERIEKLKEKERKDLGVKKGAISGIVVKAGKVPSTKKAVVFQ